MVFAGFQKLDLLNYPGKLAAAVYLRGCNFRCPYCHNAALVLPDGYSAEEYTEAEVLAYLEKRRGMLEGLVVSGGEPTLYTELPDFIRKVCALGLCVKLDTNGTDPDMLESLLNGGLIDYAAMDIKVPFEKYGLVRPLPGAFPQGAEDAAGRVKRSLEILKSCSIDWEVRTTCVRGILTPEDLALMAKQIGQVRHWYLQPFNPAHTLDPAFSAETSYTEQELVEIAESIGPYVSVR